MTSELIAAPFILAAAWLLGSMVWYGWLSPRARAKSRAYNLGYAAGLEGATLHSGPFEAQALVKSYDDGIHDARLYLRDKEQRQAFKNDRKKLNL